jgi:two-component system, cell cycle sensor histidine kinase and response regulator CckA
VIRHQVASILQVLINKQAPCDVATSEQDKGLWHIGKERRLPEALAVAQATIHTRIVPERAGEKTVLVIDDDHLLRTLTGHILTGGGYRVLTARNSGEALQISRAIPGAIDLFVTDVVMPGLQGPELARCLMEAHPEAKVLLISGYAEGHLGRSEGCDFCGSFLQKPFCPDELLDRVRRLLGP